MNDYPVKKYAVTLPVSSDLLDTMRDGQEAYEGLMDSMRASLHEAHLDRVKGPRYGPHRRQRTVYDPAYLERLSHAELLEEAKELFECLAGTEDRDWYIPEQGKRTEWEYHR